jgi:hypothetical protein
MAFVEPVTLAAKYYDRDLRIEDAARELGLPFDLAHAEQIGATITAPELGTFVKASDVMRRLSLDRLAAGEPLPREVWEEAFQRAARELRMGVPMVFDVGGLPEGR